MFGDPETNPKGWDIKKLGEVAQLQGGYAFKSNDYANEGIRIVQISNVNKDTLDWNNKIFVPNNYLEQYKAFELIEGDVVLAMTRPIIKSLDAVKIACLSKEDAPSLLNQRVGRFNINKKIILKEFLIEICRTSKFMHYIESISQNSLQPNISSRQVEDYNMMIPPLSLQTQFADFVQQVDKSKFDIQDRLTIFN